MGRGRWRRGHEPQNPGAFRSCRRQEASDLRALRGDDPADFWVPDSWLQMEREGVSESLMVHAVSAAAPASPLYRRRAPGLLCVLHARPPACPASRAPSPDPGARRGLGKSKAQGCVRREEPCGIIRGCGRAWTACQGYRAAGRCGPGSRPARRAEGAQAPESTGAAGDPGQETSDRTAAKQAQETGGCRRQLRGSRGGCVLCSELFQHMDLSRGPGVGWEAGAMGPPLRTQVCSRARPD